MGFALAQACAEAGASVEMIAGPTSLPTPPGVSREDVKSAADMARAVDARVANADLFIGVAAVADYTPGAPQASKLKKTNGALTLTLEPTIDILARVAAVRSRRFASDSPPRPTTSRKMPTPSGAAKSCP